MTSQLSDCARTVPIPPHCLWTLLFVGLLLPAAKPFASPLFSSHGCWTQPDSVAAATSRCPRDSFRDRTISTSLHQSTSTSNSADSGSGRNNMAPAAASTPKWFQHEITITAPSRGCHLITSQITKAIANDLPQIKVGMCNLFIQHTSASLTINENADPDVRRDMEVALNKLVPAAWTRDGTFVHTMEGEDDMPGHVKSSLMGPSVNVPIRNGRLALGTWQGIYLNEHRDQGGWGGGHARHVIITLQGQG